MAVALPALPGRFTGIYDLLNGSLLMNHFCFTATGNETLKRDHENRAGILTATLTGFMK